VRPLSIADPGADWSGARVLVRSDVNAPLDGARVTDDARIRASVPTIQALTEAGASVAVCSHLGRPNGSARPEFSLAPCAARLGELLGTSVELLPDCVGVDVRTRVSRLAPGEVVMLENTRFHAGEEANDADFAASLADGFTHYVNDAFGAAHRAHASTAPFVAVLGGSKVSDKLPLIETLLEKCDRVIIGGAMCFTFFAAMGDPVGNSLHEDEAGQEMARALQEKAIRLNCMLQLPVDVLIADRFDADAALDVVPTDSIPDGWMGVDIGPQSSAAYGEAIAKAATVFWNGPMGAFEIPPFAEGTRSVAKAMASAFTHVSTGGGAALELMEGKALPGVAALPEA